MAVLGCICFNPCFIGTYSFTSEFFEIPPGEYDVLILVLLELILLQYIEKGYSELEAMF